MRTYIGQLAVGVLLVSTVAVFVWYVRMVHNPAGAITELYFLDEPEYVLGEGVTLTYAIRNRTGVDHTYGVRGSVSVTDADFTTIVAQDVFVRDNEARVIRDTFPYNISATSTIRIEIPDLRQFIYIHVSPPS